MCESLTPTALCAIAVCRRSGLQPRPHQESIRNGVWVGCISGHFRLPCAVDSSFQPAGFLSGQDGETKFGNFWRILCARPSYMQHDTGGSKVRAYSRRNRRGLLGVVLALTVIAGASSYAEPVRLKVVAVRKGYRQLLWALDFRLWAAGEARAEEAARTFNLAAQPLANALVVFSEQSGLAVMAPADLVRDKAAPAVEGNMPPLTALDRLLKGSGLKYSRSVGGALTIVPAGSSKATEGSMESVDKHFSPAVSPGSAVSFGFPSGRAPASGVHC